MAPQRRAPICFIALVALSMAGCGDDGEGDGSAEADGTTLTIYSSLPLQGSARVQSPSVEEMIAVRAALARASRRF